jgi:hypothetical protein
MVSKKVLAILLLSVPYGSQYADHMCRVATRALEKGHAVEIFLYGDAVHAKIGEESRGCPFSAGAKIAELIEKGAKVFSYPIGPMAGGSDPDGGSPKTMMETSPSEVVGGVHSISTSDFVDMLTSADRLLSFGGG